MISQDDRWELHYEEIMQFMKTYRRRPSKYHAEDRNMLHWIKYNKKRMMTGSLSPEREEKFRLLLKAAQQLRRLNQYAYGMPRHEAPAQAKEQSLFNDSQW